MASWSHIDDPVRLGVRLRQARTRAGFSQRALAFPGCTYVYLSRIESGDRAPSLQVLRRLALRLGVSEGWLARGESGETSDDVRFLLDGLGVESLGELRRLVELGRARGHRQSA